MQTATLDAWNFLSYNENIGEYLRSNIIFSYEKKTEISFFQQIF